MLQGGPLEEVEVWQEPSCLYLWLTLQKNPNTHKVLL